MKYVASIREYEQDSFFSPIKTTYDYALRVLAVLEKLLSSRNEHKRPQNAYILLDEEKCARRVFVVSKTKIESFVFNYNIVLNEGCTLSVALEESWLSYEILSCAKMIINQFMCDDRKWINEEDNDLLNEYRRNILDTSQKLIRHIFYSEPSYLRYDYDPKHDKEEAHPKHHLDINHSVQGAYKIGINSNAHSTQLDWLMDVLSQKTDCHILT